MILFEKKNQKGEIVASNFITSSVLYNLKTKEFKTNSGILIISSDESDLVNSSRIFKKVGESLALGFDLLQKSFIEQIHAHSHTLKKIQGQLIQKVEGVVNNSEYSLAKSYGEQKSIVIEQVKNNPEIVADSLIYLQKRIFELGAHMASFEILHMGEHIDLDFKNHNLRRLLINILYAFEEHLDDSYIKPHFMFEDEMTENNKISADYKTLNSAFYNFFDNAIKYSKPSSEIRFYLHENNNSNFKLVITMKSLKIDQDELEKVFCFGYRSRNCNDSDGSGVGMYVVRKALYLNNLNIQIIPDYADMERFNGKQYILNKFIITKK